MTESSEPLPHATPFDERTALAELEDLADKIQKSRLQREQTVAEFDAFVKAFRHDRLNESIADSDRERRRLEDRSQALTAGSRATSGGNAGTSFLEAPPKSLFPEIPAITPSKVERPGLSKGEGPPAPKLEGFAPGKAEGPAPLGVEGPGLSKAEGLDIVDDAEWAAASREIDAQAMSERSARRPRAAHVGVAVAALAVLVVGVMLWRSASEPSSPAPASSAVVPSPAPASPVAAPSAVAAAQPPPAVAPAAKPAGPPRPINIEFVTLRPVWARLTVDGRRAFEREFAANQRIPLGADRAIAVRAGDAGAIRLIVDGRDLGVLGRDGQVFERTFTPTPAAR